MCNNCNPTSAVGCPSPWAPMQPYYYLVIGENGGVSYNGIHHRKFITQAEAEKHISEQISKSPSSRYLVARVVERMTGKTEVNREYFA